MPGAHVVDHAPAHAASTVVACVGPDEYVLGAHGEHTMSAVAEPAVAKKVPGAHAVDHAEQPPPMPSLSVPDMLHWPPGHAFCRPRPPRTARQPRPSSAAA